jgi:hypothetical protein
MLELLDVGDGLLPDAVVHLLDEAEVIGVHPHGVLGDHVPEPGIDPCLLPGKPFLQIFICP